MFFLILTVSLTANTLPYLLGISAETYYSESPDYTYDEPVLGAHIQLDLFNLIEDAGIGAATFQKLYTLDDSFNTFKTYDLYIHNFSYYSNKQSYFLYGFYGGVKRTEIEFENHKTANVENFTVHLPLIGFRFSSEKWGMEISWTQAKNRKPILSYELKFRNSNNMILRLGRVNRGVTSEIKSELYIRFGYELFN